MKPKYRTPPWLDMRKVHLRTYPECRACGTRDEVVVHHLRYRGRRGLSEKPGDLVTLCRTHHNDLHRRHGRTPPLGPQLAYIEWIAQQVIDPTFTG